MKYPDLFQSAAGTRAHVACHVFSVNLSQLRVLRQILVETIKNRAYGKLLRNLQSRLKYKFWDLAFCFCFSYRLAVDFF